MSYQRFKDGLSSEKGTFLKRLIKVVLDLADLGLNVYNIIQLHKGYAKCERYNEYPYIYSSDCANTQNDCTYYSVNPLTNDQIQQEDCYISKIQGYVKTNVVAGGNVVITMIVFQSVITLVKILHFYLESTKRRYQLIVLFVQLFFSFCNSDAIFLMAALNCDGDCAVLSDTNKSTLDLALKIAVVPLVIFVLFIIFGITKCCCSNSSSTSSCEYFLIIIALIVGVLAFDVANGILLGSFHTFLNLEIPLKITIALLMVLSVYGLYSIYSSKKSGYYN